MPPIAPHASATVRLGGHDFLADRSGALIWPAAAALLVADLHLEKGSAFAGRGVLLPPYDSRQTLINLEAAVARHRPRRIICLGDSFHDGRAEDRLSPDDAARLVALAQGRTLIWLVGITNAINWLDGLDGLAAGVSGIAAVGLLSVSFSLHQPAAGLLAAALAGSCLGFLRHNFNPARIFMGDGGSYFLGFALAAISIVGPAKGLTGVSLLLPLLILSLPLADMSAVIMGRLSEGHSPFYPDRRHLHHRLLRTGLSHRRTVLLIYAFTQWLGSLALVLVNAELRFLWLALATAVLIWVLVSTRRALQQPAANREL